MKPTDLNPLQALLMCWAAGAVLARDGDDIYVEARKGAILSELAESIRRNKAELLTILPERVRSTELTPRSTTP